MVKYLQVSAHSSSTLAARFSTDDGTWDTSVASGDAAGLLLEKKDHLYYRLARAESLAACGAVK